MTDTSNPKDQGRPAQPSRRDLVTRLSSVAMVGGLAAGYGTAAAIAGRFLSPARPRELRWTYVCTLDRLAPGESLQFRTPTGERVTVARNGDDESAEDFVALSSTCPHLGCQVHWQVAQARFFCPCHNGVFSPSGEALEGPPADAGTDLSRYPLEVRTGVLFMLVPVESLA